MSSINKKNFLNKRTQDIIIKKRTHQLHTNLKRGLLPYSIMFLLKIRPHYSFEVHKKLSLVAEEYFKVANNVVHDHLNKFAKQGIVESYLEESTFGAARKYYYLTKLGEHVFKEIVVKQLYPLIVLFSTMMENMIQEHKISDKISKKDLNKFQNIISEVMKKQEIISP